MSDLATSASGDGLAFRTVADLVREHAAARPDQPAVVDDTTTLRYGELDVLVDRVAGALQHHGVRPGDAIAICAAPSTRYAALFVGALRAAVVVAPLAPSVTADSFASMLRDAGPALLFVDQTAAAVTGVHDDTTIVVSLDGVAPGLAFDDWLAMRPGASAPAPVVVDPGAPFNIIYSSGTTGEPKGIVQSHGMRWTHVMRASRYGYGPDGVTLLATPLYSNTTLVVFFPTLAFGGTLVLLPKFDATRYLELAQHHRVTHTMLVPVQYQRIMSLAAFDRYDLGSFRFKFCTSAPFAAALKADVVRRWPGSLVEFYGMTEGGGTCILVADEQPAKLHTVGRPAEGHDIRLIDDAGVELPAGGTGEVVGHSAGMMTEYHRKPERTREAEWFDPAGKRFIRTGDVGRFDEDGFLVLLDRKKDMIISGGFNVFPSDLEAVVREHPDVADGATVDAGDLMVWVNDRVGKTQRLARLTFVEALPRSAIGKVLKRALRDAHVASGAAPS